MRTMVTCPRCGQRVAKAIGKGRGGPVRHNAHGKPCVRVDTPATPTQSVPEQEQVWGNFSLLMETRGIVLHGEALVVEGALNVAAAWADLSEKLEALGIRVTRLDVGEAASPAKEGA